MFGFNPLYAALFAAGLAGAPEPTPVYSLDFMTGVLPSTITFSRSSQATRIGPTGLMEYAANRVLLRTGLTGGTAGTVGAGAVAPTGWVFISTGGTVAYQPSLYGAQTAIRFVGGGGRPSIGQNVTCSAGLTYVLSFRVEALDSGPATVDSITSPGALPGGVITTVYINGVLQGPSPNVAAGDYVERVMQFTTTGANLQFRFGPGAAGTSTADITMSSPQVEVRMSPTNARATPFVEVGAAAYYGPRFDYDPVTLQPDGVLIEAGRTNLVAFWRGALAITGGTQALNAAGADGVANVAVTVTESSAIVEGHFAQATAGVNFTSGTVYAMTRLIKPGTADRVQLATNAVLSSTGAYVNFSLTGNGSILASGGGGTGYIRPHGNGFYACTIVFTASSTQVGIAGIVTAMINSDTAGRIPTYLGTGLTIIIDGNQVEAGVFPTSMIPTFGSTATRVADALTTTSLAWLNPAAGTVVSEYKRPIMAPAQHAFSLSDNGSFNNIIYQAGGSGSPGQRRFDVTAGGVNQAQIQLTTAQVAGVVYKDAMRWEANNFAASENGAAVITDVAGTIPTPLNLLSLSTGQTIMYIRRFSYYNTALTNSQLVTLSTV